MIPQVESKQETLEEAQAFIEKANKEPIIHGLK
jgi:hypothetical protein